MIMFTGFFYTGTERQVMSKKRHIDFCGISLHVNHYDPTIAQAFSRET